MLLDVLHSEPEEPTRTQAHDALQVLGLRGQDAAAVLLRIIGTVADARLREIVAHALSSIGAKTTLQILGMSWPLPDWTGRSLVEVMLIHSDDAVRATARNIFQAISDRPDAAASILNAAMRASTDAELLHALEFAVIDAIE